MEEIICKLYTWEGDDIIIYKSLDKKNEKSDKGGSVWKFSKDKCLALFALFVKKTPEISTHQANKSK